MSLQPQRTDLAWSRTSLATLGLALLVAGVSDDAGALALGLAALAAVGALGFVVLAQRRARQLRMAEAPEPVPAVLLGAVAAAVVLADVAGLALVLS